MGKYSVEIVSKAEKEFLKLPESVRTKIRKQIILLGNNPRPFSSKKLRETEQQLPKSSPPKTTPCLLL
jgi:mRNA-degrading endonuclease RelE of RelBE toxin-antitoxin system